MAYRGETNSSTNAILEIPQGTFPDNFQVKVSSLCQSVCQFTIKLDSKEGDRLKYQRDYQVPSQRPHQFIFQIESSRDTRGYPRDMQSIMPVSLGFRESGGNPGGIASYKPTKYTSPVPIINTYSGPVKNTTTYPSHVPK